jgi:FMN-dependent NADH-azoreductase
LPIFSSLGHQRGPEQAAAAAVQRELIEEFLGAGAYLFTVPMYNYSMPSVFKAWLDQIMVVGVTIAPPSAAGRPALVISARGGGYGLGPPTTAWTTSCPHWKPPWATSGGSASR